MSPVLRQRVRSVSVAGAAAFGSLWLISSLAARPAYAQGEVTEECAAVGRDIVVADGDRRDCDMSVVGGDLRVDEGGHVAGDVGVVSGDLVIAGTVEGSVAVAWGDGTVSGDVEGDVFVSGDLELLSGARIGGDVTALGRIERGEDVEIGGSEWTLRNVGASAPRRPSSPTAWLMPLVFTLVTVGLAALFAALAVGVVPGTVGVIRDAAGTPGGIILSIFIGSLALVALPILLLATLITVVGPLIVLAVYGVGTALGSVGAGEILGRRLAPGAGRSARAAIGAGSVAAVLAVPLYFGVEMGLGRLYCGTALAAWCAVAWALGASIRGLAARRTSQGRAADVPPRAHEVEIPDDAIERAESLVRTIATEAKRLDQAAVSVAPPADATAPDGHDGHDGPDGPDGPAESLTDLAGMTPIYVALLRAAGIDSTAALASSNAAAVQAALDRPGIRPVEPAVIDRWLDAVRRGG